MQLRSFRSQYSPFVLCLPPPGPALGEPPGPPRTGEGLQYGLGSRMLSGLWKHTAALLPHGHLRGAPSQVKLQQHLTVPAAPGSGQAATITPRDSTRGWDLHMGTERKAGAPCWRGKQVSAGMGPAALHRHSGATLCQWFHPPSLEESVNPPWLWGIGEDSWDRRLDAGLRKQWVYLARATHCRGTVIWDPIAARCSILFPRGPGLGGELHLDRRDSRAAQGRPNLLVTAR